MTESPLDLEFHEEETAWDVWKRRLMFVLLIALCVTFAAPTFGSCSGAFDEGSNATEGEFTIDGVNHKYSLQQFLQVRRRLYWQRLFFSGGETGAEDDDVWQHVMLDAAARQAGVHVADSTVAKTIARVFSEDGAFDEGAYRARLKQFSNGEVTHEDLSITLKERLRIREYLALFDTAADIVPSEEAYGNWKRENVKLSVEYLVQPHEGLRAEVDALEPTDDALQKHMRLPQVKAEFEFPATKVVEIAYVRVLDLTPGQAGAMEEFAAEAQLFKQVGTDLASGSFNWWWTNKDAAYTRANWHTLQQKVFDDAMTAVEEWEKADEATRGPKPPVPEETGIDQWPADPKEHYGLWEDVAVRELLAREVLRHMAARAERESKSLADVLPQYEQFGVKVAINEKPLADSQLGTEYPEGLGRDSELVSNVKVSLRGPVEGEAFAPVIHREPVGTTNVGSQIKKRGFMVLRLAAFEAARPMKLDEVRERVTELWRQATLVDLSKKRLQKVQESVEAGEAGLEAAGSAVGLPLRRLSRFNLSTTEPRPPILGGDEDISPEEQAAYDAIRWRNRVQRYYTLLDRGGEPGKFHSNVLTDTDTKAAYLIRVISRDEPTPIEMPETSLQIAKLRLRRTSHQSKLDSFEFAALAERYELRTRKRGDEDEETPEEQAEGAPAEEG